MGSVIKQKKELDIRHPVPLIANDVTPKTSIQRYEHIPLDFIKGEINIDKLILLNNSDLNFVSTYNEDTGEYNQKRRRWSYNDKKNNSFKFKIFDSGRIEISGSVHKYFNNGIHNYNDFTHRDFINTINLLKNDFGIEPNQINLTQFEIGVNLILPGFININDVLNGCLFHKNVEFKTIASSKFMGIYRQAKHTDYILKVYNKSQQYRDTGILKDDGINILRIEIKYLRKPKEYSKFTLEQYINKDKTVFINDLILKWDEIIFFNFKKNASQPKYYEFSNPEYWRKFFNETSRQNLFKHRKKIKEYNSIDVDVDIQPYISKMIREKVDVLQNTLTKKVCILTGIDISMQRDDSILLSHTGLKNLMQSNPAEYERIKGIFLTGKWWYSPLDIQIKEIAHSIRSWFNNRQKRTVSNQIGIFS